MLIIRSGITYFAIVFGVGFVLGTIRTLLLVPKIGEMHAELIETPFMLVTLILAARWIVKKFKIPKNFSYRIGTGIFALCLLLLAEILMVFIVRQMTVSEFIVSRNPISGTVYLLSLVLFAVMPALVRKKTQA